MTRYAEGTKVPVASSRGELSGILAAHGVVKMGWMTEPDGDTLMFELGGHQFRWKIVKPTLEEVRAEFVGRGKRWDLVWDEQAKVDAEWRRRWRAHVLLLKAKLEFAEGGDTTVERELLPYLVAKDGRTIGELIDGGGLPLLVAGGSK